MHVRLSAQVVNFVGPYGFENPVQAARIDQVAVMKFQSAATDLGIFVEMIDSVRVEVGGATDDAVNFVPFSSKSSVRYEPSWPVIPVINARFMICFPIAIRSINRLGLSSAIPLYKMPPWPNIRPYLY